MSSAANGDTGAQWLTTSQASAALGVSERTVQRRCNAGKLTARKVITGDGEKWEVNLGAAIGADSGANGVPPSAATLNECETPQIGDGDNKVTPESADSGAIGDATSETVFLRAQLDAMNEALKREQSAHEQTRQLLAGALQMASRQLPNATPPEAPQREQTSAAGADSHSDLRGPKSGRNRARGLRQMRDGLKAMFSSGRK